MLESHILRLALHAGSRETETETETERERRETCCTKPISEEEQEYRVRRVVEDTVIIVYDCSFFYKSTNDIFEFPNFPSYSFTFVDLLGFVFQV